MPRRSRRKRYRRRETSLASRETGPAVGAGWVVYMLRCRDGSLYTGITNDIDRRLSAHASGTASKYTRSRLPVTLVYRERQATKSLALRREAAIKRLDRRRKQLLVTPSRASAQGRSRATDRDRRPARTKAGGRSVG